tara:strand:+ start:3552 stop:4826 length:1275 start_codon:yes stop_codon:yes gene_type:complete
MVIEKRKIHIIGINSFEFEELSSKIKKLILDTKNIAVPKTYLEQIKNWFKTSSKDNINFFESESNEDLINWLKKREENSLLITRGDPLWFGIGRMMLENFEKDELTFYPANTCVQLACSKLKIPWQGIKLISIHGRDTTELIKILKTKKSSIAIIPNSKNKDLEIIRENLIELQLWNFYEFWICEELGHNKEKIRKFLMNDKLPKDISNLSIVLLLKKEILIDEKYPLFGINDNFFKTFEDRPNLITKREIRIQILADLELPQKGILWDIGAGCGTIGLEALKLRPNLRLFAIDKRFGTKNIILENAKRLGVTPEVVLEKDINELIKTDLDKTIFPPDRVIIGGCNYTTKINIINLLQQYKNRKIIIVIPIITYEILRDIRDLLVKFNYQTTLNLLQTYKNLTVSEGTRFEPNNPVFILKGKSR